MLFTLIVAVLVLLQATESSAPTCVVYMDQGTRKVACGGISCTIVDSNSLVPLSSYRIGPLNTAKAPTIWYNLYPYTGNNLYPYYPSDGRYWDYHTQVPGLGCRGGFGLHNGTSSGGCITVTNNTCMESIKQHLDGLPVNPFNVSECKVCFHNGCLFGIGTLEKDYIGDLTV